MPAPSTTAPSGLAGGLVVAGLLAVVILDTRLLGEDALGAWMIPVAGIVAAMAFGRRCERVHPDEPWLPRLLVLGTIAKLVASYLRYLTLTKAYGGVGDATTYDGAGRKFVAAWIGHASGPELNNLRQTNFIKWLTGVVYYLFGRDIVAGFLVFGLFAVIGSYFWYRAFADSVPSGNRRLFLLFMMFAPSVVFWPSSLGKEAVMQVGVGGVAWATTLLLNGRLLRAVPLAAGAGWLLWVVRPHLLALVTVAAAVPYLVGRVRGRGANSLLARPAGMVLVGVLVVFTVTAGAKFLGIDKLSVDAIEEQLDEETARTSKGGSSFSHGSNSLNPLRLPMGAVTVLFRPFPWEADSSFQLLASAESAVVIVLILRRFGSITLALRRCRIEAFIVYCWVLLAEYSMTFSSFANFGLLNRQRSLVLPALYALIAVEPKLLQGGDEERREAPTVAPRR